MTNETRLPRERILVIGRSPNVIVEAADTLRSKGFIADATNQFDGVLADYDTTVFDVIVFGGMVPPATKDLLRKEISATNSRAVFIQGFAGIAGVIVAQVEAATSGARDDVTAALDATTRTVRVTLVEPTHVTIAGWWATSFTPPEPKSTSLRITSTVLPAGEHSVSIPREVPSIASFVTVAIGAKVWAFTLGAMPQAAQASSGAPPRELPAVQPVATHLG